MFKSVFGVALATFAFAPVHASVGLTGDAFSARYHYPDLSTVYSGSTTPSDFTVGAGAEGSIDIEGVTDFSFDFANRSLTISIATVLADPTLNNVSFNGLIFTALNTLDVNSATAAPGSTVAGFDSSRVSLSGNQIRVNLAGLNYHNGETINIAFGAVPEPATWALMLGGFGLAGAAIRSRRSRRGMLTA